MSERNSAFVVSVAAVLLLTASSATSTLTVADNHGYGDGSANVVSARDGLGCC